MNESIDYMLNPDKYHTVPARNVGECDEQYKKRLEAYSIGFEAGAASRQAEIDELKAKLAMYEREGYKLVPVNDYKIDKYTETWHLDI